VPIAKVQLADGKIGRFDVPEGTSEDEVLSFAKQQFGRRSADRFDPTADMTTGEKVAAGAGKFVMDAGLGARQIAASIGIGDKKALDAEAAEVRERDKPLMDTTAGKIGYAAPAITTALVPGANSVTGAAVTGGALGALQPTTADESRLKNTAMGTALGAAGQKIGEKATGAIVDKLGERAAARVASQSANAARDATLASGKAAGYVVPPTQANATVPNTILEGLSGKILTAQKASAMNQPVTNRLVAQELGLPVDQPITRQALAQVRANAGKAYEAIKNTGTVQADQGFHDALDAIVSKYTGAAKSFPALAKDEVPELISALKVPTFESSSAVDAAKVLRATSDKAFRGGNKELGLAARSAADAIEDQLGRHLQATGAPPKLLADYKQARELIAKTYSADGALNAASGDINAAKLAARLNAGKPISGDMRTAAEFSAAFPKATQPVARMGSLPQISVLDAAVAALRGDLGGVGWVLGRPMARAALLSKAYQQFATTPRYTAPLIDQAAGQAVGQNRLVAAMRAGLPASYVTSRSGN